MIISKTAKKSFFFSFVLVLIFSSCYLKKTEEKKKERTMSSYLYDLALKEYLNKISSKESESQNLVLKNVENQLFTYTIQNGKNLFVIEKLYQNCKGQIDCKNFYIGFDNADYVDAIVLQSEESENDLDSLENNGENPLEDEESFDSQKSKDIEETLENSKLIEKLYIDRLNELKILEFEKELFIPNDEVIIEKNEKSVSKSYYDDLYRVIKKEHWSIGKLLDSKISKTELFEYYDDTLVSKSKTEITEAEKKVSVFNKNGFVEKIEEYSIFENQNYLISETNLSYDEKDRINEKTETKYIYDEEYKMKPTVNTKRFVYHNKENEELPADYEYFENDILKIKVVYSETKGNFTQEIFFDNMSVKSFYEDNLLKKDIYYIDGVEKRVVNYE